MRAALAVAAVLVLAGCGASAAHSTAPAPPQASAAPATPAAPGAAFCASLKASTTPQVTYASEVEHQVGLASGGGSVTPEAIAAGRAIVALWIAISCPQYAHLEEHG